jgi:hypothetical protein
MQPFLQNSVILNKEKYYFVHLVLRLEVRAIKKSEIDEI